MGRGILLWLLGVPIPIIILGSVRYQRRLEPRYTVVREKVGELRLDGGAIGERIAHGEILTTRIAPSSASQF